MGIGLFHSSLSWAACSSNGNITSGVTPITLNTVGCADDGSMQAQLLANDTLNVVGSAITAPIVIGSPTPWTITLQTGSNIIATGNGIVGNDGVGSLPINLTNYGTINVNTSGALLTGGATVTNYGSITGGFNGVDISSANGGVVTPVTNSVVNNYGTISAGTAGVHLGLGGTINNYAGGSINGFVAIETEVSQNGIPSGPTTVNNYATIGDLNTASIGVLMNAGGTVNNYAGSNILAGTYGVAIANGSATINNAGTIHASLGRGIYFESGSTGGSVVNSGLIQGDGSRGIFFAVGSGSITNTGTIQGGTVAAIQMQNGSATIINSGLISSGSGLAISLISGGNNSVTNSGTINGNVVFSTSNDHFLMTGGTMTGQLLMGTGGNETATFQNVTDANLSGISIFNGGGGGGDQLIFDHSQYTGASLLTNWETITLTNGASLNLNNNLILGGTSLADPSATLNINNATLNANIALNSTIQASARPVSVNNSGIINLQSPAANNSLTIQGNYQGINGALYLNTVLNSDSSPSDKLIIDAQNGGGSATGATRIFINNTLGQGAQTTNNGILVVDAINGATSSSGAFSLGQDVMAGPYEYLLYEGGVNGDDPESWFLRSMIPTSPTEMMPNYRKEVSLYSAYSSSQLIYSREILGTFHQRVGAEEQMQTTPTGTSASLKKPWLRFINTGGNINNDGIFNDGPDFDFQIFALQGGIDLITRGEENGHRDYVGLYGVYGENRSDVTHYDGNLSGHADFNAYSLGAYWTHIGPNNWYIDGVLQGTRYDPNIESNRTSLSAPNSNGYAASLEGGYPFNVKNHFIIEPELQFIYQNVQGFNANDAAADVFIDSSNAYISRFGTRFAWDNDSSKAFALWAEPSIWYGAGGSSTTSFSSEVGLIPFSSALNGTWASIDLGVTYKPLEQFYVFALVSPEIYLNGRGASYNAMAGLSISLFE